MEAFELTVDQEEIKCYHSVIYEHGWPINCIMSQKWKCFSHIKHNSGLETTVLKGMVSGGRGRSQPARQWIQVNKDTLGMRVPEAVELTRD